MRAAPTQAPTTGRVPSGPNCMGAARNHRSEGPQWIDRAAPALSALAWIVPLAVISVGVLRRPGQRSLDPIYRWAIEAWQAQRPLYTDSEGFIYLPTFIPIYSPFAGMPVPWGEIAWRAVAAAGIGHALWSLMALVPRPRSPRGFLLLSIACLPVSLGALQMGQANAWIAMSLFQAAAALGRGQHWRAAAWLGLGFAIKPIVLAAMGLAVLRWPRAALPLAAMTAGWILAPFLTAPTAYVLDQYAASLRTILGSCATVTEHRFADVNGILRSVGVAIEPRWSNAVSMAAGLSLACVTLAWGRRFAPDRSALQWLNVSCCYLLLFNPMTEANSYCMLGVPAALLAWEWLGRGEDSSEPRQTAYLAAGWVSIAVLLLMGSASELARPWLGNSLDLWFFPCCALAFGAAAIVRMVARAD